MARHAAELPFQRVSRALDDMERAAVADEIAARVPVPPSLIEAKAKIQMLYDKRLKASSALFECEAQLQALQAHTPSLFERLGGSHAAQLRHAEAARDLAKTSHIKASEEHARQVKWTELLDRAHVNRLAQAAPLAGKATRNLAIVRSAREMLATTPRRAFIGPFAFIAEAALRAGYKSPSDYGVKEEEDRLPTGDLRNFVNMWGLPLR